MTDAVYRKLVVYDRSVGVAHGQIHVGDGLRPAGPRRLILVPADQLPEGEIVSLYCIVCLHPVDEGLNQCYNCHSGFTSQLACSVCNRPVSRGLASCPWPHQSSASLVPVSTVPLSGSLEPLPGLRERMRTMQPLPERYTAGKHGVVAEIHVPLANVISIQHEIQLIALLETYADEANHRVDLSDIGRKNIRACRLLAIDLKEEVELIKGPQG